MSGRFRPRRSLVSEMPSLMLVVLVPLVLAAIVPSDAFRPFAPVAADAVAPAHVFVTLTPEQERKACETVRTAWRAGRTNRQVRRIDLWAQPLPDVPLRPVQDFSLRTRPTGVSLATYATDALPPTLAAPPPVVIAPQADVGKVAPAFSREELLELN